MVALAIGALLFAFEVFVLDGWFLFVLSFAVPLSIVATGKGNQSPRLVLEDKRGLRLVGAWGLMLVLLVSANLANDMLAETQAREIAKACWGYRQQAGRVPPQLSDLVPRYIAAVPHGKLVLGSRWRYRAPSEEGAGRFPRLTLDSRTYSGGRSFDFATDTLQAGPSW